MEARDDLQDGDAVAIVAVRTVVRAHAPDLHFASFFLPRAKREAVCAAVAFCRLVRDAVLDAGCDEQPTAPDNVAGACCSGNSLDSRIALVRDRIDQAFSGRVELPLPQFRDNSQHVLHAFSVAARRYHLSREPLLDLVEGSRMDLTIFRYATRASLLRYCEKTGAAVARLLGGVLGLTHSGAGDRAGDLGTAMRLLTILRELRMDAGRGRIYLPLEDLVRHRCLERDLLAGNDAEGCDAVVCSMAQWARELLQRGCGVLPWLTGDGSRLAVASLVAGCDRELQTFEKHGLGGGSARPVTTAQRLRLLPAAWRLARSSDVDSASV